MSGYRKIRQLFIILFFPFVLAITPVAVSAQQYKDRTDTFFLAKKKGLLGRFGKSISRNNPQDDPPEKLVNPFLKFRGKTIRSVILAQLEFGHNIYDTFDIQSTFGTRMANRFHRSSSDRLITNNLFFREGERLYPYLLADNERYLRDLVFIQDARILVDFAEGSTDSVDIVVLTKDVFSLGGKIDLSSTKKGRAELKEENFLGTGNRVMISGFYESNRSPMNGFGAEWVKRNIRGSFVDYTIGYNSFRNAFNSGRNEEVSFYTRLEKPMVTPFKPLTGAVEWNYSKTINAYVSDSLYISDYKYAYYKLDGWIGYSLDSRHGLYANREIRRHRFVALRVFTQRFLSIPFIFKYRMNYLYTDFTGLLGSYTLFRQNFYKTNFIYGFGRNEDIPVGFNLALTAGYINKESIKRPYAGADFQFTGLRKNNSYFNYTFRAGTYYYRHRFEDIDLLFSMEKFTRLKKMGARWYHRFFYSASLTGQANPKLNTPLFLNSNYGLPYMNNEYIEADLRVTGKMETVFYNTRKVLGFRFAPFAFADASLLKPTRQKLAKSDLFSSIGGGLRTRNENLVFGTVELKAHYFPRTNGNMNVWKIELNSNIRFKYNSGFIRRPDFIMAN